MWNLLVYIASLACVPFAVSAPLEKSDPKNTTPSPLSMYDVVLKQCPNIVNTAIVNHTELKQCVDWSTINSTNKFSRETIPQFRCLLYYDTLVSFCKNAEEILNVSPRLVDDKNMKLPDGVGLPQVCNKTNGLFEGRDHNLSKLLKGNECFLLCLDLENFSIDSFCAKAYYFATFNTSAFKNTILDSVNGLPADLPVVEPQTKTQQIKPTELPDNSLGVEVNSGLIQSPDGSVVHDGNQAPISKEELKNKAVEDTQIANNEGDIKKQVIGNEPQIEGEKKSAGHKEEGNKVGRPEMPVGGDIELQQADDKIPTFQKPSSPLPKTTLLPAKTVKVKPPPVESIINNPIKHEENSNKKEGIIGKNDNLDTFAEDQDDDNLNEDYGTAINNVGGKAEEVKMTKTKPEALEDDSLGVTQEEITDGESYFFSYFMAMMCMCIVGYVGYHNRHKIFALLLEGRQRGRRSQRGGRRPNSANYHKLDSNLEEALSSSVKKSASNVIY